jgi:hypothetical protein
MRLNVVVFVTGCFLIEDKLPIDCNSDIILKVKGLTQKMKQEYYDDPHNVQWRDSKLSGNSNLIKIIGSALFDVSEKEPVANFTDTQLKQIKEIIGMIEKFMKKHKDEENICVSVVFVLVKAADGYVELPVIKLLKHDTDIQEYNNIFIDFCGRVYKNWQDYLKNNTLSNCIICYPKNCVYSSVNDVVELENGTSTAPRIGSKIVRGLDIGCAFLSFCAALVATVAWGFPVPLLVIEG